MAVACSPENILAYVGGNRINFLKVDASLGDPGRSWHVSTGDSWTTAEPAGDGRKQIVHGNQVAWSGAYLALWSSNNTLVTLVKQMGDWLEQYTLSEAVLDCLPCPVGRVLPGCSGFTIITRTGGILQLCQVAHEGVFQLVTIAGPHENCKLVDDSERIIYTTPWIIGDQREGIVVVETTSGNVCRKSWSREGFRLVAVHNPENDRLVMVERNTTSTRTTRVVTGSLKGEGEDLHVSEGYGLARDVLFVKGTSLLGLLLEEDGGILVINYEEGTLVSRSKEFVPLTFPLHAGLESPVSFCLDQSGSLFLVLYDDGSVKKCWRHLEHVTRRLIEALNSGEGGWRPLLNQLAARDQSNERPVSDILENLSPSLRKAHQFAMLSEIIIQLDNSADAGDLAWFCHVYYRLAHYWEVAIAGTIDMASTMKALERGGDKMGSDNDIIGEQQASAEQQGSEQPKNVVEFIFECIPSLWPLTIEVIGIIRTLFATELSSSKKRIVKRALRIATIHHRLVSCMRLIGAYRRALQKLHKKYATIGAGMRPLATYFGDLLGAFEQTGKGFDWQAVSACLQNVPQEPVLGLDYLFFRGSGEDAIELYSASYAVNNRIVRVMDRDSVTGAPTRGEQGPCCPLCYGVRVAYQDLIPVRPFWADHYYFCCACGYPTNYN